MRESWRVGIAMRLLGSAADSRLISFTGVLSIGGLVLAVAVLVTVLSVMNGFDRELRERVLGVLPQGTIYMQDDSQTNAQTTPQADPQTDQGRQETPPSPHATAPDQGNNPPNTSPKTWHHLIAEFLEHPDVIGAAPVVEGTGLILHQRDLVGVNFRGVEPEYERTVSILPQFFIAGALADLASVPFGVVMGEELATQLGVDIGSKITLVLPRVSYTLAGPSFTTRSLTLVGLFRVGADIDQHQLLVHLPVAMRLKRQQSIDGIVIRSADLFETHRVMQELILSASHKNLYAVSWMRRYGNLYDAIQTQKTTLFLLLIILVAVAAFNVVSNLVLTVDDNRPGIAILRTLGASSSDLRLIFLIHGLAVGVIGILLGVLIGVLLTLSLSSIYVAVSELFSLNLMSEYFVRHLPTEIMFSDIGYISAVSLVICLLATLYPASRAAAAIPVRILQHEI